MQCHPIEPRLDLAAIAKQHGYAIDAGNGVPGWDESKYYCFTLKQIEGDLEEPSEEIEAMCFQLLDQSLVDESIYLRLGIPEAYWSYVADSWRQREKDLYGRMDFSYDGSGTAKLLEYNADTPTTLYDAAIFQWVWLEQAKTAGLIPVDSDQSAQIHELLVDAFRAMGIDGLFHFACLLDLEDDRETVRYLEECAQEAGLETEFIAMRDIGVDAAGCFSDLDDRIISTLFKLYPWEWIMADDFGQYLTTSGVSFIEPPWKSVLSNKGLLALLWEKFEGHPNLLPTYFEGAENSPEIVGDYVRKPLLSRQGGNVEIVTSGDIQSGIEDGYGAEGYVRQAFYPLPEFHSRYPVVGSWLVAGQSAGISIRECQSLITDGSANSVPHVILD